MNDRPHKCLTVRPLFQSDTARYRQVRQDILSSPDARYYSDSFERERCLSELEWIDWCTPQLGHFILGTFAGNELVGIIMITRQGGSESPLVEWEAAWVHPQFRGTGVGHQLYNEAKEWSQELGFSFVVGFIRNTFTPALDICGRQGFVFAYSIEDELWADGTVGDTHAYLLDLRQSSASQDLEPSRTWFNDVMPFLMEGQHAPKGAGRARVA